MTREYLIQKWLDHNLTTVELQAFKRLDDYNDFMKLDQDIAGFKADTFNEDESFKQISNYIDTTKTKPKTIRYSFLKIAAALIIGLSVYFYTATQNEVETTLASEHKSIVLPDSSLVELNALSEITFNTSNWKERRDLILRGEAFFKVAKGEKFDVNTDLGIISVLGTAFNVKQRYNYFEVTCYEGKVAVNSNTKQKTLLPGDTFLIIDGKYIVTEKENLSHPSWLNHESTFKSIPYREVIAEFERQYNVSVLGDVINDSQNFTGSFTHNDIEIALKSITLPLLLEYSKTDNIIRLSRE